MLYQRDYLHLLVKYGLEPPSQLVAAGDAEPAPPLRLDARSRRAGRSHASAASA